MNKCNYTGVSEELRFEKDVLDRSSLDAEKKDEIALPEFVKELPKSKKKKESAELVTVDYTWGNVSEQGMKIKTIEYRKAEALDDLYRINKPEGSDNVVLKHNTRVYVLRKAAKNVVLALINASSRLKGLVENVVGWLKTLFGSVYMIVKVDAGSRTLDQRLENGSEVDVVSSERLNAQNKERLCEAVVERMVELQKNGLILRNFSVNNIWLTGDSVVFADLRNLKLTKKKSVMVDEFRKTLSHLSNAGLASKADVFAAIAYYIAAMEDGCSEWYAEKKGKQANDHFKVALEIERMVYN